MEKHNNRLAIYDLLNILCGDESLSSTVPMLIKSLNSDDMRNLDLLAHHLEPLLRRDIPPREALYMAATQAILDLQSGSSND